jgi:uncharacterized protein (DUF433 family)
MAFPVPLTSALSGATKAQLAYWRRRTRAHPPLLVPSAQIGGRFLYSWADLVALRSLVYLRQEKSLPRIRKAVAMLQALESEEWEHLAEYRLIRTAKTIVVWTPRGEIVDLEQVPGAMLDEILMADVLGPFKSASGRNVPELRQPKPQLTVDPAVLGGYPVVSGTRVPYDIVAGLADDGLSDADIVQLYPSVAPSAVSDALVFAQDVAATA